MKGELIGINGRGSFDKRGRVNSGVGYAISINQIKNFLGHLRAGLDTDHATLGASVTTQTEQTGIGRMEVTSILEDSDVARRGLNLGDQILTFAGRNITSVNHFKNVLGLYPRGWRMPMEFRHDTERKEVLVRLMGLQRKEIKGADDRRSNQRSSRRRSSSRAAGPSGPAAKFYRAEGRVRQLLLQPLGTRAAAGGLQEARRFPELTGDWTIEAPSTCSRRAESSKTEIDIKEVKDGDGTKTVVNLQHCRVFVFAGAAQDDGSARP